MTVQSAASSVTYNGNGATTVWDFAFEIDQASYAVITLVDTTVSPPTTTVLQPQQYSITGLGNANGGTVTYPLSGNPLVAGQYLTIQRVLPLTQNTSFPNQGGYYPKSIEGALDYITMIGQQLSAMITRAIQVSVSDPGGVPAVLPPASERALQGLVFDAEGNPIAGALSEIPISAPIQPFVSAVSVAAARQAIGLGAAAVEALGGAIVDDGAGNLTIKAASATAAMMKLGACVKNDGNGNLTLALGAGTANDGAGNLAALLHGQCVLQYVDATHIELVQKNGGWVRLNGTVAQVPAAGLALNLADCYINNVAGQAVTAASDYLVSLGMFGGALGIGLFGSPTYTHAPDTTPDNLGVEVLWNGANPLSSMTIVGRIRTTTGSQVSDSGTGRLVASWFNRTRRPLNSGQETATTTSGTPVQITGTVCGAVMWGDEAATIDIWGQISAAAAMNGSTYLYVDGAQAGAPVEVTAAASGNFYGTALGQALTFAEGYHTFDARALSGNGATGTWAVTLAADLMI